VAITRDAQSVHWNYFLALEQDLAGISRFVEFHEDNYDVYSIELAHLLLASASEIDVVLKSLCQRHGLRKQKPNIHDYRKNIQKHQDRFIKERCMIPRYGLTLTPWKNWENESEQSPFWWQSYNNVKHNRSVCFAEASLKNVLNSMAALFIANIHYHAPNCQLPAGVAPLTKPSFMRIDAPFWIFEE
jgi:hypothetical protein